MHLRKYWCNPFLLIEKIRHFKLWTDFIFYLLYTYLPSRRNLHIENSCSIFDCLFYFFYFSGVQKEKRRRNPNPRPHHPRNQRKRRKSPRLKNPWRVHIVGWTTWRLQVNRWTSQATTRNKTQGRELSPVLTAPNQTKGKPRDRKTKKIYPLSLQMRMTS